MLGHVSMSLLAKVDFLDFFQNFGLVMGSAAAFAGACFAIYYKLRDEWQKEIEKLDKKYEQELNDFKESHATLRVADAARIAKLEYDYDEAIRLLSVSRMFVPGQPLPPGKPRPLPPKH